MIAIVFATHIDILTPKIPLDIAYQVIFIGRSATKGHLDAFLRVR